MFGTRRNPHATSLAVRLVAPLTAIFASCLLVGGLVSWQVISAAYERQVQREIDADFIILQQRVNRLKVVAVIDAIDYRLARTGLINPDAYYLVTEPDGTVVTGNLADWPDGIAPGAGWARVRAQTSLGRKAILARGEVVDDHYHLLVGRSLAPANAFRTMVAGVLLVIGLTILAVGGATALLASRRLAARFSDISETISWFRRGEHAARVPVRGDDEIAELGRRVNELLGTLERQIGHLKNLSSTMAHEFRTPLSRIRKVLREGRDEDAVGAALEEVEGLLSLSTGLLEIAEHESAVERRQKLVDLADILNRARPLLDGQALEKGVDLVWQIAPAPMLGEEWLLVRLVTNLVENAIEATPSGGRVTVSCASQQARAVLTVSDCGAGVDAPDIDTMIARHAGADVAAAPGKHGLGLKLVRAITLRHGGRIRLERRTDGLTLRVSFA